MGATVLSGKAAGAFAGPNGETYYLCFEKTHEQNVRPHTPDWGCIAFGRAGAIMERLARSAAACEGGMLRSPAGHIRPENYLAHWRTRLAKPHAVAPLVGTFLGRSMDALGSSSSGITPLERLVTALSANPADAALLAAVQTGLPLQLSLHDYPHIFEALYGTPGNVLQPWRMFSIGHLKPTIDASLAMPAPKAALDEPVYQLFRFSEDRSNGCVAPELVGSIDASPMRFLGWAYAAVGKFTQSVVGPAEVRHAGIASRWIPKFREAAANTPVLPEDCVVSIKWPRARAGGQPGYREHVMRELLEVMAHCTPLHRDDVEIRFTLNQLRDANAEFRLTRLERADVAFDLISTAVPATEGTTSAVRVAA